LILLNLISKNKKTVQPKLHSFFKKLHTYFTYFDSDTATDQIITPKAILFKTSAKL
jgi:hypothetical protein